MKKQFTILALIIVLVSLFAMSCDTTPAVVTKFKLDITKAGTGTGLIKSDPAGIDCGGTCSAEYEKDVKVTLTATPDAGSSLSNWEGCDVAAAAISNACEVTMDKAKAVTVTFTKDEAKTFELTVKKAGDGTGAVTSAPEGISCGEDCAEAYAEGTKVTLTAKADEGSSFSTWSGACSGAATCEVAMSEAKEVTAEFTKNEPSTDMFNLKVELTGSGEGTVTSEPIGIDCDGSEDCEEDYAKYTAITLTPTAKEGSTFTGWDGACVGDAEAQCVVNMTEAKIVKAIFEKDVILTVTRGIGKGKGSFSTTPAGLECGITCAESFAYFPQNSKVTITAKPTEDSKVGKWSDNCEVDKDDINKCVVTLDQAKVVSITFEALSNGPLKLVNQKIDIDLSGMPLNKLWVVSADAAPLNGPVDSATIPVFKDYYSIIAVVDEDDNTVGMYYGLPKGGTIKIDYASTAVGLVMSIPINWGLLNKDTDKIIDAIKTSASFSKLVVMVERELKTEPKSFLDIKNSSQFDIALTIIEEIVNSGKLSVNQGISTQDYVQPGPEIEASGRDVLITNYSGVPYGINTVNLNTNMQNRGKRPWWVPGNTWLDVVTGISSVKYKLDQDPSYMCLAKASASEWLLQNLAPTSGLVSAYKAEKTIESASLSPQEKTLYYAQVKAGGIHQLRTALLAIAFIPGLNIATELGTVGVDIATEFANSGEWNDIYFPLQVFSAEKAFKTYGDWTTEKFLVKGLEYIRDLADRIFSQKQDARSFVRWLAKRIGRKGTETGTKTKGIGSWFLRLSKVSNNLAKKAAHLAGTILIIGNGVDATIFVVDTFRAVPSKCYNIYKDHGQTVIKEVNKLDRVSFIGAQPSGEFKATGGQFRIVATPLDEDGNFIVDGITKDSFSFSDINVAFVSAPTHKVTGGSVDYTEINIVKPGVGEASAIVLDLDSSGSMTWSDGNRLRVSAAKELVKQIGKDDEIAVLDFGAGVSSGMRASRLLQKFTSDKALLNNAIDQVGAWGGTPLYESILDSLDMLKSENKSNQAIVVLTDGVANGSTSLSTAVSSAKTNGVPIYSIGLGEGVNTTDLQKLSNQTGGTYVEASDSSALKLIFENIGLGIVEGHVVVTSEGHFVPALTQSGIYTVSGVMYTTVSGHTVSNPFSFRFNLGGTNGASLVNTASVSALPYTAEEELRRTIEGGW